MSSVQHEYMFDTRTTQHGYYLELSCFLSPKNKLIQTVFVCFLCDCCSYKNTKLIQFIHVLLGTFYLFLYHIFVIRGYQISPLFIVLIPFYQI